MVSSRCSPLTRTPTPGLQRAQIALPGRPTQVSISAGQPLGIGTPHDGYNDVDHSASANAVLDFRGEETGCDLSSVRHAIAKPRPLTTGQRFTCGRAAVARTRKRSSVDITSSRGSGVATSSRGQRRRPCRCPSPRSASHPGPGRCSTREQDFVTVLHAFLDTPSVTPRASTNRSEPRRSLLSSNERRESDEVDIDAVRHARWRTPGPRRAGDLDPDAEPIVARSNVIPPTVS